ncbi:MAG TPA: hypothetical protein VF576_09660 [Rubricoccaceae bacterium]|jgi:hypothetical protein
MPPRLLRLLVLLTLTTVVSDAEAQSCWPVAVLVEVRDPSGRRVDPASLDSVVTREDGRERALFGRNARPPAALDTTAYVWQAGAGCRVRVDRMTLYGGGHTMHLDFGMEVDSDARRGPSSFAVQTPSLRSETFRLRWDPTEPGGTPDDPTRLTAERWERVWPP